MGGTYCSTPCHGLPRSSLPAGMAMHKHLSLWPAQPRRSGAHNMASTSELQKVRAKIEELEKEVKELNAQIAAADPSRRLELLEKLIAPLHAQLDTLRKKEERLDTQLSAGERPG